MLNVVLISVRFLECFWLLCSKPRAVRSVLRSMIRADDGMNVNTSPVSAGARGVKLCAGTRKARSSSCAICDAHVGSNDGTCSASGSTLIYT